MNGIDFVKEVWEKLPLEYRARIEVIAANEKKSLAEEVEILLGRGVSTLSETFLGLGC